MQTGTAKFLNTYIHLYTDVYAVYRCMCTSMAGGITTDLSYLNLFRTGPMCDTTGPTASPGFKYLRQTVGQLIFKKAVYHWDSLPYNGSHHEIHSSFLSIRQV